MQTCAKGLHPADMTNSDGQCHGCKNLRRKLNRAAVNGRPLCWTGTHTEPPSGLICECGEEPPGDHSIDWAIVERASHDLDLPRNLTTAEALSAVRTLQRRLRGSDYDAVAWADDGEAFWPTCLGDGRRARYLVYEWARANGDVPDSILQMDLDYAPEDPADYPSRYEAPAA